MLQRAAPYFFVKGFPIYKLLDLKKSPKFLTTFLKRISRLIQKKSSKHREKSPKLKIAHAEYAIQIAAWPSLEEARIHQLELIDAGFDAYTQRFFLQKKDEVWYRVRIGNFDNRNRALVVKKQIESLKGITTWLDILSSK